MIPAPAHVDPQSFSYKDIIGERDENAPRTNPRSVTASANVSQLDDLVLVNATGGAVTMTLETAQGCDGRRHAFIKTDASANAMTVAGAGSQTINGSASVSRTDQYGVIRVQSNGTNWNAEYIGPGTVTVSTIPIGKTTVSSGSLSGASFDIQGIPQSGAYLYISAKGMSNSAATRAPCIRFSTDGSTFDVTAGSYGGYRVATEAAWTTANALGDTTAAAAATTNDFELIIRNYQAVAGYPIYDALTANSAPAVTITRGYYKGGSAAPIVGARFTWDVTSSGATDAGTFEVAIFN